jgi:hypothetical protein
MRGSDGPHRWRSVHHRQAVAGRLQGGVQTYGRHTGPTGCHARHSRRCAWHIARSAHPAPLPGHTVGHAKGGKCSPVTVIRVPPAVPSEPAMDTL